MSAETPENPQTRPGHPAAASSTPAAAAHSGSTAGGRPPGAGGPAPGHAAEAGFSVDVWERTKGFGGPVQAMDRRLFMQLSVFDCDPALGARRCLEDLGAAISSQGAAAVLYQDMNNPFGIGVLSWSTDPADFVTKLRPCFEPSHVQGLKPRQDFTMVGRSYASGYESDLQFWLIDRPVQTVLNDKWPWAIWYPLRRSGEFARLDGREQGAILKEHGEIGRAYGEQDLAHDVRLACHGLDANDNEFLIGLIGKELHPLSHVIQAMRKTRQTAEYISQMGPFFVGYVASRHAPR